ncbi:hypothetical protein REPUB_Repub02eG0116800 [Reevesia pubescens]
MGLQVEENFSDEHYAFDKNGMKTSKWGTRFMGAVADGEDKTIWSGSSSGNFSVSSAYNILINIDPEGIVWNQIWKLETPHRIKFFLWTLCHNQILTRENCVKRCLTLTAFCPRCNNVEETRLHLLRNYQLSKSICVHGYKAHSWMCFVNVDGSATSNPYDLISGGVCRDSQGLKLAWQRGYRIVILESDSLIVENKVLKPLTDKDLLSRIILECKSLMNMNYN